MTEISINAMTALDVKVGNKKECARHSFLLGGGEA
jgi:hypothetical protein